MLDNAMEYFGGDIHISHGIDIDRFGYLDLVDVVEKLGYVEVGKIYHKICGENGSVSYIHIHNDATLMEVIGSLQPNKFYVHLFVDNEKDGQKKASEESVINNAGEKGAGGTTDHSQMKKKEPRRKTPPAQNLVPQPSASENPPPAYTQTETAPPVAPQSAMKQPIRKSPRLTQTEPTLNDHGKVRVVAVLVPVEVAHIEELVEVAVEGLEVAEVTPLALKKVQSVSSMDVWFGFW
ncbi:RING/U-box superfamily protein [Striga asiatica]|uniref:RING/U-box superfamily protein n=1 Tax=Striga asiatica TaxID=4170 RepID=A0A5A7RKT1_STRAF|nr:RING/U-box superfamily protein [Striga asiatica]